MSGVPDRTLGACDRWIRDGLGGAAPGDGVGLARLRGVALAGAALTLPMTAWKAIGPVTISDLLLVAAVVLLLPRFRLAAAGRLWVPAVAVASISVGGAIGTVVVSPSDLAASAENIGRFAAASIAAMLLVVCWRPGRRQIASFGWPWVAAGVISAVVALLTPSNIDVGPGPPGLTPHPNHLAIISVVLLGVTLGLVGADRSGRRLMAGIVAGGILFAAVVDSGSRAGFAAALIVIVLVLVATRDRIVVRLAVAAVVVGLILLLLGLAGDSNGIQRLGREGVDRGPGRRAFNDAAWDRFKAHPVTGVGFADALQPHNLVLTASSGAGLLGIVGAVMLIVLALRIYALTVWRRIDEDPARRILVAGLAAAVIGYLAASLFQNVIWDRNVWIAIALMTWGAALLRGAHESAAQATGT